MKVLSNRIARVKSFCTSETCVPGAGLSSRSTPSPHDEASREEPSNVDDALS